MCYSADAINAWGAGVNTAMALANNLRTLMVERGLSPDRLAIICALELDDVRALLLGEESTTLAHLDCLIRGLDIAAEDLLVAEPVTRQRDVFRRRAQLEQYWSLSADQRAQVDAFSRGAFGTSRKRPAIDSGTIRRPVLSDAELRVVMKF